MATFSIEFERGTLPGPEYEDYNVSVDSICGGDAQDRRVRFNDLINGDFVLGYDYTSTSSSPASTVRIESYLDEMIWRELPLGSGPDVPVTGFTPSELKDNSTGSVLTYPYNIDIADLPQLSILPHSTELICNESSKYTTVRTRSIEYYIFDSEGRSGPLKTATYQNTAP